MKSDRIDAEKLARALRAGLVRGIYVRPKDNLDDRGVLRIRKTIQIQVGGYKTRIKHLLHSNGVELPERFSRSGTHWSRASSCCCCRLRHCAPTCSRPPAGSGP